MGIRMVLTRYALLLLLCGCAGMQGIPMAPSAPAFSPVEDAPITIGQPGYVGHEPERSPHKRMLNQTPETMREPGIWAGDAPDTQIHSALGVALPAADNPGIESAANACSQMYMEVFHEIPDLAKEALRLTEEQRACLVMVLVDECMLRQAKAWDGSTRTAYERWSDSITRRCSEIYRTVHQLALRIASTASTINAGPPPERQ